jgi:hypothetical protein
MAKVTLRATGGLNLDVSPNNLQEGDYIDASNIVFDTGKDGGAGPIRMFESIKTTGISFTETVVESFQNFDGKIYVLVNGGTTASIYELPNPTTSTTKTLVLTYTHGIITDFTPDIKVIGSTIVWNYAESGTILSYPLPRGYNNTTITLEDLKIQKKTPNNVVSIVKSLTGTVSAFLEANDFQFASRYQYDSGEYSVLSNYSQMFKGEKGTTTYTITFSFAGTPTYVTTLETYVRIGNNGTWRRMDTRAKGDTTTLNWTGDIYESLDSLSSSKPFDATPINAAHIEIAQNRIFLANIKDDYDIDKVNTVDKTFIELAAGNGYELGAGDHTSYLGASKDSTSSELGTYYKPFANSSTYGIGIAFYDDALKTRGVEKYQKFTTGKFTYPILPTVNIRLATGWQAPSWAKYAQLVYTKNISKSYVYEGFASSIFFEMNDKTITQTLLKNQLKDVNFLVVDLMGMFKAGKIYAFVENDRISINTPNGILDLNVEQQLNNFVYCRYSGAEMTIPTVPTPSSLYFEIYSPKAETEEESLLFYEYGNLMPISAWAANSTIAVSGGGTLNINKLIGDMVFSKISMPTYSTSPFIISLVKDTAGTILEDVVVANDCAMTSETLSASYISSNNTQFNQKAQISPLFSSTFATNDDTTGALVDGNSAIRFSGSFEAGMQEVGVNKITLMFDLQVTENITLLSVPNPNPSVNYRVYAQVYKVPFDFPTNTYLKAAKFGSEYECINKYASSFGTPATKTFTVDPYYIELSTQANINPKDKFYIVLRLETSVSGDVQTSNITVAKRAAGSYGVSFRFVGDKLPVKEKTIYNPDTKMNTTDTKFIIRSISNATINQQWNTSAGKPSLKSSEVISARRTNAIRYSGSYIAGTKVNNINSFFALDSNEVPIENGEIMSIQRASRLQGNGSMLLALCKRETSYVFLGEQQLTQGNNTSIRALTSNMIGTIRNMGASLGLQDKLSVMNYKGTIWWWDDFNKKVCKYTEEGIEVPSDLGARSYFLAKGGDNNSVRFAYDPFYNMCFVGFTSDSTSLGYSDNLKRWISSYSFRTGHSESYGDKMVLFKDNVVYKSLQSGSKNDYNSFFGTAYNSTISFVMNTRYPVNPLNVAVWHEMNVINYAKAADPSGEKNYVKDNLLQINITNENNQATQILESNFIVEDNRLYAHVMRDTNTTGVTYPLTQGNYIVGYLNKFVVTLKDKTQSMRISSIDVEVSPVSGHS